MESVAEAVFVLPRPDVVDGGAAVEVPFPRLLYGHEPAELAAERWRLYQHDRDHVAAEVQRHLETLADGTVERIVDYVNGVQLPTVVAGGRGAAAYREVPTGVVCTGVNVPDHAAFFARLAERLRAQQRHHVAVLTSADAGGSLRALLTALIRQLVGHTADPSPDGDDAAPPAVVTGLTLSSPKRGRKPLPYDYTVLQRWYAALEAPRRGTGRPCARTGGPPGHAEEREGVDVPGRLVVLLQDFHGFDPVALADLITILSDGDQAVLPFVLLLGVPTTATAVADTLPSPALTRLATERFSLPSATASLEALVRMLFTDRGAGVVLGRRSFAYLVQSFLGDHLSVRQLARALQARDRLHRTDAAATDVRARQYALMDHYFANPLAVLTEPWGPGVTPPPAVPAAVLALLTPVHAQAVRLLPSFQRYCEEHAETAPAVVRRLVTDDVYLLQTAVPQWISRARDLHRRGVGVRRVLGQLQARFATLPVLQAPDWVVHQASVDGALAEEPAIRSLLRAISFLPRSGLALWLAEAEATLTAVPRWAVAEASTALVDAVTSLRALRVQLAALPELAPEEEAQQAAMDRALLDKTLAKQAEAARADAMSGPVQSKRRRATFLEGDLLAEDLARMTDRARRTYKQLGADVRGWVEALFQHHLPEPGRVPLLEAVCHNRGPLLRRAFNAQPQLALLTALARPWQYLPRPAAVTATATAAAASGAGTTVGTSKRALAKRRTEAAAAVPEAGPDLCIFYGLYRTCPRLISLPDLYVDFAERVRATTATATDAAVRYGACGGPSRARFMRTLAEAQWLGLIKRTRRRTDHVVRLCWVDV